MKISELTENDVIHIRNKKEAKGMTKLLRKSLNPLVIGIGYLNITGKGRYYNWAAEFEDLTFKGGRNIIPASKFLKPSLKKRVKELEAKVEFLNQHCLGIGLKASPDIEVHFDEVEKLPEKWCVKHTPETLEWIKNNAELNGSHIYERSYYMFPANGSGNNSSNVKPDGYTEISFETFKRLVLKWNVKPVEIDFSKAGQLVKSNDVFVYTDGFHNGETFSGTRLFEYIHHSEHWAKDKFTLCTEPVTIKNN